VHYCAEFLFSFPASFAIRNEMCSDGTTVNELNGQQHWQGKKKNDPNVPFLYPIRYTGYIGSLAERSVMMALSRDSIKLRRWPKHYKIIITPALNERWKFAAIWNKRTNYVCSFYPLKGGDGKMEKRKSRETGKRTRRRRGYSICRAGDTARRARGGGG
jgi:hypothetical protein